MACPRMGMLEGMPHSFGSDFEGSQGQCSPIAALHSLLFLPERELLSDTCQLPW